MQNSLCLLKTIYSAWNLTFRHKFIVFYGFVFDSSALSVWYSVCPALFSARPSKACRIAWVALHVIPRPSIALTCCLSDKHSRCWHYQMLSACRPPRFCPVMALRRGERSGHLTLSDGESACVCGWTSMAVYAHVTNRPASSVPYQAGPILTSMLSTSSAIHHSAVACHSENLIHVLAENSWL